MSTYWLEQGVLRHLIPEGESVIGRGAEVTIRVNDRKVSRTHARLRRCGEVVTLEDLGSSNGTWLNARRVQARETLTVGDVLALGGATLRFSVSEEEPPASVSLGVELVERRIESAPTPAVTDAHLSTVAIIEALVSSPTARSAPARVAGHVSVAVDRMLAGLGERGESLSEDDAARVRRILRRVTRLDPALLAWAREADARLGAR